MDKCEAIQHLLSYSVSRLACFFRVVSEEVLHQGYFSTYRCHPVSISLTTNIDLVDFFHCTSIQQEKRSVEGFESTEVLCGQLPMIGTGF